MNPPLQNANSSAVKREFGKYFQQAVEGKPTIVSNHLTNKKAVLVNYDQYMDLLELIDEMHDEDLNKQLEESYAAIEKGEYEEGLEGLIEIMQEEEKKELLKD